MFRCLLQAERLHQATCLLRSSLRCLVWTHRFVLMFSSIHATADSLAIRIFTKEPETTTRQGHLAGPQLLGSLSLVPLAQEQCASASSNATPRANVSTTPTTSIRAAGPINGAMSLKSGQYTSDMRVRSTRVQVEVARNQVSELSNRVVLH